MCQTCVGNSGLQVRIWERNPLADYIPCFTHPLNQFGHSAVDNISAASKFFELVKNAYCFFSASPHRWEILVNALDGLPVVKCLSDISWAAHSDAHLWIEQFTEHLDKTAKV